jgi:hypothetical protein
VGPASLRLSPGCTLSNDYMENELRRIPNYQEVLRNYQQAVEHWQQEGTIAAQGFFEMRYHALLRALDEPGRFELGSIGWTDGAEEAMQRGLHIPAEFAIRHKNGDYGDLDPEDRRVNEESIARQGRVLSRYQTRHGDTLWVITDAGWQNTTLLRPEEY